MKKILLSAFFALLLPWQVEAGTVVFHDTFVDTDGTNLEAHTPDTVGTSWSIVFSDLTQEIDIVGASSTVKAAADAFNQGAFFSADPAPTAADVDIEVDLDGLSTANDDDIFIVARYQDADNWYALQLTANATIKMRIHKNVAGSQTSIGTSTSTPTGTETVKFELRGSALKAYLDSGSGYVEEISATDSNITAAGKTGLGWAGWNAKYAGHDLSALNIVTEYKVTQFPAATAFLPGASLF